MTSMEPHGSLFALVDDSLSHHFGLGRDQATRDRFTAAVTLFRRFSFLQCCPCD